ncbi:2-dehydropantoate 2-reductase [Bradyrhizobium arachidis]|nr:2-dehydropantoate 2-reductase [Bradyrhizobium arachidis]
MKTQDGGELRTPVRTAVQGDLAGQYDVVLLCCKAYDLDSAMDAIGAAVGPETTILPLLNGVRHLDVLANRFGRRAVLGGLTVINAALLSDGTIQQSQVRVNITAIGELNGGGSDRCSGIKAALETGGIAVQVSDNITAMMWEKFYGFVCSATVATLCRSRSGSIARAPSGSAFVSAVIDECARVVTGLGHPPVAALDSGGQLKGLFAQTGLNYGPSILIDMEDGRATEGEHTIGDMAERAAKAGINAPLLTAARCNLDIRD